MRDVPMVMNTMNDLPERALPNMNMRLTAVLGSIPPNNSAPSVTTCNLLLMTSINLIACGVSPEASGAGAACAGVAPAATRAATAGADAAAAAAAASALRLAAGRTRSSLMRSSNDDMVDDDTQ